MRNFIVTLTLLVPTLLLAQIDRSVRPEAGPAPKINIEDSEVFETDNGITVILSENHKLPKVSFSLVMGSAPMTEGERAGLSDVAGSLITSGTTNRTKDELDNEVDYIGARLSADNNSMYLSCLTKHMDKGLELMSDVLMNANFPKDEVDRIITQNESALASAKSDAGTMSRNVVAKVNFPEGHPYGEVMTEESLKNINRDAIVSYYKKTFTPKGSYLVVVGDIDRAKTEEIIEKYFASWTGSNPYKAELGNRNQNSGNRVIFVNKQGAVQSVIAISFPMDVAPGDEDYLKLQVLNGLLGGGVFGNRLMQNLREDKAYTYGCRSRMSIDEYGSYFTAGGNFRNEVTDSAITEILYEIDRIGKDLVEDDEIKMTKAYMAGAFARSLESPSTVARFALNIIKNDLPKDYYQTYLQKLEAVTKQDLLDVAKKYLTAGKCNIVVVGNEEVVDRLLPFDGDGKIEKLDAFGNEVIERIPADISADELINSYIKTIAEGAEGKKLDKKLKKIKSMKEVVEYQLAQAPFPMKATQVWTNDGFEGRKMEGNGMTFQKSYFDGEKGANWNMQGGSTPLTDEEVEAKKKSSGLISEMNYKANGMAYEILGMEEVDGKLAYVLKVNDGKDDSFDYYDKETFYKVKSVVITTSEEETRETVINYGDFKSVDGFIFPHKLDVVIGPMALNGKVVSREFNVKVDTDSYK